jgi:anaerobic magnesium-protoporphyrin IX monomethyl ester cyclase
MALARGSVVLVKLEPDVPQHLVAPPFGILYLASALEQAGFEVTLVHEPGSERVIRQLVADMLRSRPLLIGFSTLTGPSILPTLKASREIKQVSNVPVVWGGLHPTMLPEQTLESGCVDIVAVGEGEETIAELATALADGGKTSTLERVAGLVFRANGSIHRTGPRPFIRNLDQYAPAWHYLDVNRYLFSDRHFYTDMGSRLGAPKVASILTSRGCPWRCAYCYNQFVNRRSFRAHSAARVLHDVRTLKERYGVGALIIEDDCFFAHRARGLEIAHGLGVPWTVSIRASELAKWGPSFVREIAKAGCQEVRVGAESGSQRILELMEKDISVDDIRTAVRLCVEAGIRPALNFMIGIPGESDSDMRMTLDLMDELEALGDAVAVNGPSVFLPWPGTALYERAVAMGFKPPSQTAEWGVQWGGQLPSTPFLPRKYRFINYYRFLAFRKQTAFLKFPFFATVLQRLARMRWRRRFFRFPADYYLPRFVWHFLRGVGLRRLSTAFYE